MRNAASAVAGDGVARLRIERIGGDTFVGFQACVEAVERRAIGADDFRLAAHVEENMRMIEGGFGADALELAHADPDLAHARLVAEFRCLAARHVSYSQGSRRLPDGPKLEARARKGKGAGGAQGGPHARSFQSYIAADRD